MEMIGGWVGKSWAVGWEVDRKGLGDRVQLASEVHVSGDRGERVRLAILNKERTGCAGKLAGAGGAGCRRGLGWAVRRVRRATA